MWVPVRAFPETDTFMKILLSAILYSLSRFPVFWRERRCLSNRDVCLLKQRKSGRASRQNRLRVVNLTMPIGQSSRQTVISGATESCITDSLSGSDRDCSASATPAQFF